MDGVEAAKIIKPQEATSKIPVIIITSSAMRGDSEKRMTRSGCDEYIAKPIDIKQIVEMVNKYTGKGG